MRFWIVCFGLLLILVGYAVTVYGLTSEEAFAGVHLILVVLCIFINHLGDDREGDCDFYIPQGGKKGEE